MASPPGVSSKKRTRDDENGTLESPTESTASPTGVIASAPATGSGPGGTSSNFRNVSACNRCRHRKNRCDQQLPRCTACLKVGAKCVGFDPVSRREIPRSYVYYLETRVRNLEAIVTGLGGAVPPPEDDFAIDESIQPGVNVPFPVLEHEGGGKAARSSHSKDAKAKQDSVLPAVDPALKVRDDTESINKLVNNIGQSLPDSQRVATGSGISFARVVYAAVKSSVSQTPSERGGLKPSKPLLGDATGGSSAPRDSFFGLHTRPTIKPAPFPEEPLGARLANLYFEHANPQIPILHRGEFTSLFERVYAKPPKDRTPREMYLLNIVYAIGSGIIMDSATNSRPVALASSTTSTTDSDAPGKKRSKMADHQYSPEEYHSAAITHLENFLSSTPASEGYSGGMEELQAVLLLAGLALLRPVAPGLWYIIGVAVRLSVDLGLHFEDNDAELDAYEIKTEGEDAVGANSNVGRKQWARDLRRRLWWCVYSFDRLVSTCVGRPFGITDQVITTEFPSLLDDRYITTTGFLKPASEVVYPTYKLVAHHYFRLRLLQSEVLQVLQYRQAQQARSLGANAGNVYMHTRLPSPFLSKFQTFRDWRIDVDRRLWDWKESAPLQPDTGVRFTPLFLELNYWQAVIMLYRQSLAVPGPLADELTASSTGESVTSPGAIHQELKEDEQLVFLKVAQAGQTVLKLYRQLHRLKLVNYTFLATHHLFMSGISFLYAIWHSPTVRLHLTLDDVDFTILAATSVLTDLIENCPPAEACRDAFSRMAKATISMCMSTTGFGTASSLASQSLSSPGGYFSGGTSTGASASKSDTPVPSELQSMRQRADSERRKLPRFDMNLKDLFTDDELGRRTQAAMQTAVRQSPQLTRTSSMPFQQQQMSTQDPSSAMGLYNTQSPHSTASAALPSPASYNSQVATNNPPQPTYALSNQLPYQPFAQTISQQQPDFSFENLDFLDTFPVSDPSRTAYWGNTNGNTNGGAELDFGFGMGGTAGFDGGMASDGQNWGDGGGVDLFDGFFFGNGAY
ncbi:hypothetical protein B0A48_04538 [Cryoendolithus antarcticus]|uniref:Zn(2)-C6 fungal-type domain-containing protein n=1 Tax=Cryoendolithus antarcticus TaxID=1507870 RepID=A0A1V8TG12_9PEZI|nr:hypothetical protein B0A48_04538 [Cryoendolithus antarcticus]